MSRPKTLPFATAATNCDMIRPLEPRHPAVRQVAKNMVTVS
jgi:hypothetical protein